MGWKNFDVDGQGVGVLKLDNFHGRHMCIVPKEEKNLFLDTVHF